MCNWSILHQQFITCLSVPFQGLDICHRALGGSELAETVEICLTSLFPHCLLHSSSVWLLFLSWPQKHQDGATLFCFICVSANKSANYIIVRDSKRILLERIGGGDVEKYKRYEGPERQKWLKLNLFYHFLSSDFLQVSLPLFFFLSFSKPARRVPGHTVISHHIHFIFTVKFYFHICRCKGVFVVSLLSVSELLMGEVDSSTLLSLLPTEKSRVSLSESCQCFPSAKFK